MQQSLSAPPSDSGELIGTYRHGKGFLVFLLSFGGVMLCLAGLLLYLSSVLPASDNGPVSVHTRRGMALDFSSPEMLIYCVSGFLAFIALGMFALYLQQKKRRQAVYDVYQHGVAYGIGATRTYLPFADIEDLYLFTSGQAAYSGLITNVAFRRNAGEPFHRVVESLKGFYGFQQEVRQLHVHERLPVVMSTLAAGGAVTFKFLADRKVWSKRAAGNPLDVSTESISLTREFLEVRGKQVAISTLNTVDLNAWTERVIIRDEAGKEVLNTICTGIMSHDLFLNTLAALFEASHTGEPLTAPA